MENTLKSIFEYQKFEKNINLQSIVDDTLKRFDAIELSEEDLEYVNAAKKSIFPDKKDFN